MFRSYYELCEWKPEWVDKLQVVVIIDGYDHIKSEHLEFYEQAGIYNSFMTTDYKSTTDVAGEKDLKVKFKRK